MLFNLWFAPDLRDGRGPKPHNHPWDFHSMILGSTYVESRWTVRDGVVVPEAEVEHRAGEVNKVGRELFHEVTEVNPGHTLTCVVVPRIASADTGGDGYAPKTSIVTNYRTHIHDGLVRAGADPAAIEVDIAPDRVAALALAEGTVIRFAELGPDEYSTTEYWMATAYYPDGDSALIFDGSDDETALWTLLAQRLATGARP